MQDELKTVQEGTCAGKKSTAAEKQDAAAQRENALRPIPEGNPMNSDNAILAISLFAAFADGGNDDREREHIRRFAETMGTDAPDLPLSLIHISEPTRPY